MMPIVAHGVTVENVMALQRPANNLVDIYYDLNAPDGGRFNVSIQIKSNKSTPSLDTLSGDVGFGVTPGRCRHIVWDAGRDWPGNIDSNMVAVVATEQSKSGAGMVWIPAGINTGVDPVIGEYALTNSTGFWMDRTEITNKKFEEVYIWAISHNYKFNRDYATLIKGQYGEPPGYTAGSFSTRYRYKGEQHPFVFARGYSTEALNDIATWCNARSVMEGKLECYEMSTNEYGKISAFESRIRNNGGYILPSSQLWQYAARGGLCGKRFPWGDTFDFKSANCIYFADETVPQINTWYSSGWCWDEHQGNVIYRKDGPFSYNPLCTDFNGPLSQNWGPLTSPVMSFPPNRYGLYEMCGNAAEMIHGGGMYGGSWDSQVFLYGHTWSIGEPWSSGDYDNGFRTIIIP